MCLIDFGRTNPSNITFNIEIRIVSAPGKVLLTGGYLVLDSKYDGLVIATDSRFFTSIKSAKSIKAIPGALPRISVRSPQFEDGLWVFSVDLASPTSVALHPM